MGEGVIDFVNGLEYSTVSSSSIMAADSMGEAANMGISNGAVIAGGAFVTLSFLGLAGYFLYLQTQADAGDNNNNANQALGSSSFGGGIEEVMPMPKATGNANSLSQQLEAAQTRFQEQQQTQKPITPSSPAKFVETEPDSTELKVAEAQKLAAQQAAEAEKAAEAQKVAAQKAAEAESLTESESNLAERLKDAEAKLAAETKLREEETKLKEEAVKREEEAVKRREELTKLKNTLEGELKEVAETVRVLEDEYEFEQNKSIKTMTELELTQERLTRTQAELSRINSELMITINLLSETSGALEDLEVEQSSIRNLGKKIWRLSKSRVSNRVTFVGDFLRGRKKIKKKPKKML